MISQDDFLFFFFFPSIFSQRLTQAVGGVKYDSRCISIKRKRKKIEPEGESGCFYRLLSVPWCVRCQLPMRLLHISPSLLGFQAEAERNF